MLQEHTNARIPKRNMFLVIPVVMSVMAVSGCAHVVELGKGVAGFSTKVLQDKRPEAARQSVSADIQTGYRRVQEIMEQSGSYIYARNPRTHMIAVYVSPEDTTPVGIFLSAQESGGTLVEVSSASAFAKELIANRITADWEPKVLKKADLKEIK